MKAFRLYFVDGRKLNVLAEGYIKDGSKIDFYNEAKAYPFASYSKHLLLMIEEMTPSESEGWINAPKGKTPPTD